MRGELELRSNQIKPKVKEFRETANTKLLGFGVKLMWNIQLRFYYLSTMDSAESFRIILNITDVIINRISSQRTLGAALKQYLIKYSATNM